MGERVVREPLPVWNTKDEFLFRSLFEVDKG